MSITSMQNTEVTNPYEFILGGKAEFTIRNIDANLKYKYLVRKSRKKDNMWFVYLKDGRDYNLYAGYIQKINNDLRYSEGRKGQLKIDSPQIRGLIYALRKKDHPLPRPMILMHHGKCACCGLPLDDPESVARGVGPTCWKRLRAVHGM